MYHGFGIPIPLAKGESNPMEKLVKKFNPRFGLLGAAMCIAPLIAPVSSMAFNIELPEIKTKMNVGGYVKLDAVYNDSTKGNDSGCSTELCGNAIPLESEVTGTDEIVFKAWESRFWMKTSTPSDYGMVKTHLEADFEGGGGNQVASNSRHLRLRHAYGQIGGFLFGQTWSTFMHFPSMPETNDFGGPIGVNFGRQPMIRYAAGLGEGLTLKVAIENGELFYTGGVEDDEFMPDLVADFTWKPAWGDISVAALLRNLVIDNPTTDESTMGYGVRFGASFKIGGMGKLATQVSYGDGVGRYSSSGAFRDAYIAADGSLEALNLLAGTVSYQQKWTNKVRSTVALGYGITDDPAEMAASTLAKEITSLHLNTFFNPVSSVRVGLEYIYAKKEAHNGESGDINRIMFSTRFMF